MSGNDKRDYIEPVDFRPAKRLRAAPGRQLSKRLGGLLVLLLLGAFAYLLWYVLTARRVTLRVEPAPDRLEIQGGWPQIRIGEQVLLRPGRYELLAGKEGYHALREPFEVDAENTTFNFRLRKLPGTVAVEVYSLNDREQAVEDARVWVDNEPVGEAPVREFSLEAGEHSMRVAAPGFLTWRTNLLVEGLGRHRDLAVGLTPAWADVFVNAVPTNAVLYVDGRSKGGVPVSMVLTQGTYRLELQADAYKTFTTQLVVQANVPVRLPDIRLDLADALLVAQSTPDGALVTVDGTYVGHTPLSVPVRPHRPHIVSFSKAGYREVEREIQLAPTKTNVVEVALQPVTAPVQLDVEPEETELVVDGEVHGPTPETIKLTTIPHRIEIRKEGFQPFQTTVIPKSGWPQIVTARLEPLGEDRAGTGAPARIETSAGYELKLIRPGAFMMGASRREQGRRSNETLRRVKLTRAFYMGLREVTNREFRSFEPRHNSGKIRETSLNLDEQPVVNVSWEQAALYCNWLSEKEGLPKVYEQRGEDVIAKRPMPNGYRLPTEAEWAYCARTTGSGGLLKFPWGDGFPPRAKSGNYADTSVSGILANYLEKYDDGFAGTAPPASFEPNAWGLYDLGGNVAEWCHDIYNIYAYEPDREFVDPVGPADGRFHVIRDAGWKDSSITELRLSYRHYGQGGRNDVGFRVCRYADGGQE